MKIVCSKFELIDAVTTVSRAIKSKISVDILTNVLINATGDSVILRGYDLEIGIEGIIKRADVIEEGSIAVSPKMLGEIAKKMSDPMLTLETKDNKLLISSGKTTMKLAYVSAEEYPLFPVVDEPQRFTIKSELLKSVLSKVVFAVSDDNTRAALTGVYLKCTGGSLTTVAIDGYRMALNKAPIESTYDFGVIVPGKSVHEVLRAIGSLDTDVIISLGANHVYFEIDDTKVVSRLISGDYINYEGIIVKTYKSMITVNKDALYEAFDRALLVASTEDRSVPASVSGEGDEIVVDCSGVTSVVHDIIEDTEIKGENIDVDINTKYITDALKNIDDENIIVEFSGNAGPVIIKPTEGDSYLYLVLPIRR